ncbi:MAG: hypothetical protein LC687_02300, partial [Actinobacteria bacterium]|nr:hypothetical protein [Actinomycetota bacterium]
VPRQHMDFLAGMWHHPLIYTTQKHVYTFSHGFLCPTKPIRSRFHKESDTLFGRPSGFGLKANQAPRKDGWGVDDFLVCGHTPHSAPTFYGKKALVIDTGAKHNGPVTAAICPMGDKSMWEFVQS